MGTFDNENSSIWVRAELRHGNNVLLRALGGSVQLLVPPGVHLHPDEPDGERFAWRYAIWREDFDLGPPALSIDEPDVVSDLPTADVVEMLPPHLHEFVKAEMARQISRAESFRKPPAGQCSFDRHAQLAGRTRAWATEELAEAFPEDHWFGPDFSQIRIPVTAEEFLARMPAQCGLAEDEHHGQKTKRLRGKFGRLQIRMEHEIFVVLASALRGVGNRTERLAVRCDRRLVGERYDLFEGQSG
ncbi:MAG TPA: hypothetical protein VGB06_05745 [Solirubrobacterales bacterium]|jgi:hypothetical protein